MEGGVSFVNFAEIDAKSGLAKSKFEKSDLRYKWNLIEGNKTRVK